MNITLSNSSASFYDAYKESIQFDQPQIDKLVAMQMVIASLSFIGTLFIVFIYIVVPRIRINEYQMVVFLALSDMGICFSFFMGFPHAPE